MADTAVDTGSLSQEKSSYRRYDFLDVNEEGKTYIKKQSISAETAAKDKDTGLSANWAKAEKDGGTLVSTNEVITYTVKSKEGFELLVPNEAQQLYIIQVGLDTVQGSRAQAFMKANKEGAAEPTPEFNDYTLDLRVGIGDDQEYSINKEPSRRSLTDEEKLQKLLKSLGLAPEAAAAFLASVAQNMLAKDVVAA